MLSLKYIFKISLLTVTSLASSTLIDDLPAQAATFSSSTSIFELNNFSVLPQNPSADSNRRSIAVSGEGVAQANADGTLIFDNTPGSVVLNTDFMSDAFGDGSAFFALGESSSSTISNFFVDANQVFSFDFEVSLNILNQVDSTSDGSISTFSGVNFFLFNNTNDILGAFRAISNVDTNLTEGVDNDIILPQSSPNVTFSRTQNPVFGSNQESAQLFLEGSFQQLFPVATQVRLEVETLNRSCVQSPQTNDPCTRVPEPDNAITLLLGFLGLGLVSKLTHLKKNHLTTLSQPK